MNSGNRQRESKRGGDGVLEVAAEEVIVEFGKALPS